MAKKQKAVAVGGTFDKLHKGHKTLLTKAFEIGDHVLIGLCSEEFVQKLCKSHPTASYAHRLKDLTAFLQRENFLKRAEIVPLYDPYGPAATLARIGALIVSKETEHTAFEVNRKRTAAKLRPLQIIVVDLVAADNELPISTTRIYRGEIDREGRLLKTCPK